MRVQLKRNWFGPGDVRYRKGVAEVPDDLRAFLPKDAKVLSDPVVEKAAPVVETLRDFDEVRAASDAEVEVVDKAEAFRRQLAEERAAKKPGKK